jgi:hypothetical protein
MGVAPALVANRPFRFCGSGNKHAIGWEGIEAILDRPLHEDILAAFYDAIVPSEKGL